MTTSNGRSFFYGTDAEVYTGSEAFLAKITATPTAFGLVAGDATSYGTTQAAYAAAYTAAINPVTRTKSAVEMKNVAKKALRKASADLASIINGKPFVTDAQKMDLGLNVRKHPTPAPIPSSAPAVEIKGVVVDTITLNVHDAASSRRFKPAGVLGANIYTFVGENLPANLEAWTFQGLSKRSSKVEIQINNATPFARVWITGQWINTRGEVGVAATPISTNLGSWIVQAESGEEMKLKAA